jgi:hypothetical protein
LVNLPGIEFLQTEANAADQPMFSARYGNIYTVRQLLHLLREATGVAPVSAVSWRREDGRWVDAQRPTMFSAGFASPDAVLAERTTHLTAVRRMFAECSVFIFTLGLTEAWVSTEGDAVFPLAPGIVAEDVTGGSYGFHNFTYEEVMRDIAEFVAMFGTINPTAKCILTVSPVPLVATYTAEHVLVATTYSKAVLRAVCGAAEAAWENVYYFPAYEIITGHYNGGSYYDANKRTIAPAGVAHVMDVFRATYLSRALAAEVRPVARVSLLDDTYAGGEDIICDEELTQRVAGF